MVWVVCFFFQAEDGIRYLVRDRGLGDGYKRQVDDGVHQAVVHRDHDPAARDDGHGLGAGHLGDLTGPRAGAVEHEGAVDADVLAALLVAADDGGHAVAVAPDLRHPVIGEHAVSYTQLTPPTRALG